MEIGRRQLLKRLAVGATATAVGFLLPGAERLLRGESGDRVEASGVTRTGPSSNAREQDSGPIVHALDGPDPTYAGGEIVRKTADGVILQSRAGIYAVRFPQGSRVWKGEDATADVLEVGDWVDAKGSRDDAGVLTAESGWVFVNIGRRDGLIEVIDGQRLVLLTEKGSQTITVPQSVEVLVATESGQLEPVSEGRSALRSGDQVGMVGLRLPDGGFRATRIWRTIAQRP